MNEDDFGISLFEYEMSSLSLSFSLSLDLHYFFTLLSTASGKEFSLNFDSLDQPVIVLGTDNSINM